MRVGALFLCCSLTATFGFCAIAAPAQSQQDAPAPGAQSIPPPFPGTNAMQNQVPAPPKGPVRIGASVVAGRLLTHKSPRYPEKAKSQGIEGTVVMHAIIDKEGHIAHMAPLSGPDILMDAAMEAVNDWVYRPYMLNGFPTEVDTLITVNFNLNKNPPSPDPNVPIRLSSGVASGYLVHKVTPVLPAGVKGSGMTVVHAIIGKDGHVEDAQIISGPKPTQQAVLNAVRQWTYRPYLWAGVTREVDTQIQVTLDFNGDPDF